MIGKLNPIGIGTYNLDLENQQKALEGLLYSYHKWQNYISTSLVYANYRVVDFLKKIFRGIERDNIFVMSHLEKYIETREDVEKQVDEYLKWMNLNYIDSIQVHASYISKIHTYEEINKLVQKRKVRNGI